MDIIPECNLTAEHAEIIHSHMIADPDIGGTVNACLTADHHIMSHMGKSHLL